MFKNWTQRLQTPDIMVPLLSARTNGEAAILDISGFNRGLEQAKVDFYLFDKNPPLQLGAPVNLSVVPNGVTGTTEYSYQVSAMNDRGETLACNAVSIINGLAQLGGNDFNALSWDAVPGATKYRIYGRKDIPVLLGEVTDATYQDKGESPLANGEIRIPNVNTTNVKAKIMSINVFPEFINSPDMPYYFSYQKKLFLFDGEHVKVISNAAGIDVIASGEDSLQ